MSNLARPEIQALEAYHPPLEGRTEFGEHGQLDDFNENPIPPSAGILKTLRSIRINRYPEYEPLKQQVAEYCGVEADNILLTNGSDHGIAIIFNTFTGPTDKVVIPRPTFSIIVQSAELAGGAITSLPHEQPNLEFPLQAVREAVSSAKLLALCNPNSPLGTTIEADLIKEFASGTPDTVIMVDEAYFEFSNITAVGLVEDHDNVVVTRTFSKALGLAGLRLGYVVASPEHIAEMHKVAGPYPVNSMAVEAGLSVLEDLEPAQQYAIEVMTQAKPLVEEFFSQHDITFYPSRGNFILFKPPNAAAVYNSLYNRGILVRPQKQPSIEGTLRVTITTVEEMEHFIDVYGQMLQGLG